ncbi:amino acid adenylation domain-containing protein [Kitasatospora kifunensis]|uniref:Amino acid adenylation domain-containing protein n=1 Tax=Kitasatospora kifunensis TaxID=58351 RepID=A0A7W7R8B2_KITKI|nr:amino acid adenylation domain-containing protein [Kitasatospora kifunensis]MBB4927258.1 amino acid adenylation domain-containing protein [Kitasatospora kifunensis]
MTATRTFVDEIGAHAARAPHAPALVAPGAVVSYGELFERVERLARLLIAYGVGPEQVCAIALEHGVDAIVAMAAVSRAGGAFLTLDVGLPQQRLAAMVASGRARFLVTTDPLVERLALRVPGPTVLIDQPVAPVAEPTGTVAQPPGIAANSLAYVSHTSGSTGTPNAVLIEHRGLASYLRFVVRDYGLGPQTVALQLAPLGYDASIRDSFAPLAAGGRLVLVDRAALLRVNEFAATVAEFGVNTILSATPSFLTFLAQHEALADRLGGLRVVVCSGESLRPFLASGGRRMLTGRLVNQYGPTECTMTSTRFEVPGEPETAVDPVGTPIDGVRVHLLDGELTPVPVGTVGEVYIGGVGVARGYCADPARTAERFLADPFGPPGARLYRTGDLARQRPDGTLEYLGRGDRQLKIRGYRVDPAEIEGALLTHPAVTAAVVTADADSQGRTYLIAHLTGRLAEVTDAALRVHLSATLPPYMMPRRFTRLDRIPTTSTGKADRGALGALGARGQAQAAVRTS